jgi:hypothetical protein
MTLPEGARKRLTLCTVCCARCACIAAPARPVPPSPPEFIASNEARPPRPSLCAWDTVSPCCHAVGPRGVHWPPASTSSGWTWYPFAGPRRFSGSASLSGLFSLQLQVGGAAHCYGPLVYLRGTPVGLHALCVAAYLRLPSGGVRWVAVAAVVVVAGRALPCFSSRGGCRTRRCWNRCWRYALRGKV